MLDYKDIITKHYALGMSGRQIAESLGVSKSGVNEFLRAFEACKALSYPLPPGITNYGIAAAVYGADTTVTGRDLTYELPDYEAVAKAMASRQNMTLIVLWNRYSKRCRDGGLKFYSYRQFCENYAKWCEENKETLHFNAVSGQKMEVDFAGKTFQMVDHLTGEPMEIVVFVAVLPYSQLIYAEGMVSTKEPQWIAVNNNALLYFGGVPALVVCDNCKQAVIANKDWIAPELNKDYSEWAEHNHTVQNVTVTGQQGHNSRPVKDTIPGQMLSQLPASKRPNLYNGNTFFLEKESILRRSIYGLQESAHPPFHQWNEQQGNLRDHRGRENHG